MELSANLTLDPPIIYKTSTYNNMIFDVNITSQVHRETTFMIGYYSTIHYAYPRRDVDLLVNNSACVFYNSTHRTKNCRPLADPLRVMEYNNSLKPPILFQLWLDENWDAGSYTLKLIGIHHIDRNSDSDYTQIQLYMMYPEFDYNPNVDNSSTNSFLSYNISGWKLDSSGGYNQTTVNTFYNYDIPYKLLE